MFESINAWVERLSAKPLPVMRHTLTRVSELLNAANTNHGALSDIVALDPGFSLFVFQHLHTLPKQPREPVSKISNAISLLGMKALEQATQNLPILEEGQKGLSRLGLTGCYSRAAHAAVYAAGLAKRRGLSDSQPFATAALLHDIGEMALWSQAPDVMRGIQQLITQGDGREDAALEVLGFTLEELNQQLGSRWRLPSLVQDSQGLYNSYQPQPLTVMLACAVARASALDWRNQELLDYLELLADFLEIPPDRVQAQLHQYAAQAARQLYLLPLPLPAHRLILVHQEIESKPVSAATVKPTSATPHESPATHGGPSPELTPGQEALAPAKPKPDSQINHLHEQLTRTIRDMQQICCLKRVMFAMLSPDKTRLKARFVVSESQQDRLKGFDANLTEPSLFSVLMKKPQALWLNADNRQKYLPMIPDSMTQSLSENGFLLMSIFIREKPIGLFYADNGSTMHTLTLDQFNNFKISCQRFAQRLA